MSTNNVRGYFDDTRTTLGGFKPTKTQQHFKEQCNINSIMKRFRKTGIAPLNKNSALYGDFSTVESYQDSLHKIMTAQEEFDSLPSTLRNRFKNDPANLIVFVTDENNSQEAIELGLLEKPVETPIPAGDSIPTEIPKT